MKSKYNEHNFKYTKDEFRILMLTGHKYYSKKQAGFHHLANAFLKKGYSVSFCTVSNSFIELVVPLFFKPNVSKFYEHCCSIFYSFIPLYSNKLIVSSYFSFIYNFRENTPFISKLYVFRKYFDIDNLFKTIFLHGHSKVFCYNYDIIIFESNVSLFLFDTLKTKNPHAKFIYRISDDIELLGDSIALINYERKNVEKFDLLSSSSSVITEKFSTKFQGIKKIITQTHGIDKEKFDKQYSNPYDITKKNFVFVGTGFMDKEFLKIVADLNPNWIFHIIGDLPRPISHDNIIYYGEMKFDETIKYIKFADVGLQIRSYSKGIESLEKSLKFIQYTYCRLPIIAPEYMHLKDLHVFSYVHTKKSIEYAIKSALNFNRNLICKDDVQSWEEITTEMLLHLSN